VFTARYALSPYIKQIRFVFKGFNDAVNCRDIVVLVVGEKNMGKQWWNGTETGKADELGERPVLTQHSFVPETRHGWACGCYWVSAAVSRRPTTWTMARPTAHDSSDRGITAIGNVFEFCHGVLPNCRSQWPCGLKRGSAAPRLLGLRVRIPPGVWSSVCCECCVLSGRGLCVGLITRPAESYRLWCVSECDCEASIMRRPWPTGGCLATGVGGCLINNFSAYQRS
jgi:hypothetical protein